MIFYLKIFGTVLSTLSHLDLKIPSKFLFYGHSHKKGLEADSSQATCTEPQLGEVQLGAWAVLLQSRLSHT